MLLDGDWFGTLPIQAACEFGKAIYCGTEVDFEPTVAHELRKQVEQSGVAFMAEFPRRFAPATLRLKELIATRLGRPRLLFCHRRWLARPPHLSAASAAWRIEVGAN